MRTHSEVEVRPLLPLSKNALDLGFLTIKHEIKIAYFKGLLRAYCLQSKTDFNLEGLCKFFVFFYFEPAKGQAAFGQEVVEILCCHGCFHRQFALLDKVRVIAGNKRTQGGKVDPLEVYVSFQSILGQVIRSIDGERSFFCSLDLPLYLERNGGTG